MHSRSYLICCWVFLLLSVCSGVCGESPPVNNSRNELKLTPEESAWLNTHPVVNVRISRTYPPFEFFEQDRFQGISYDYLMAVAKKLGIEFRPTADMSWKDALESLRKKDGVDLVLMLSKDTSRDVFIEFTNNYISFPQVIITRKDSRFISNFKDLSGGTVATETGFIEADRLRRDVPGLRVIESPTTETSLEAVATGKADAYIGNLAVASYLIEKNGLADLKVAAPSIYASDASAMGIRKDWPELARILDKALAAIPEEERRRIDQKWLSVRYEHGIRPLDVLKWLLVVAGIALAFIVQLRRMVRKRTVELQHEIDERIRVEESLQNKNEELIAIEEELRNQLDETSIARNELQASKMLVSAMLDNSFQFQGLLTPDGVLVEVNRAALDFVGVTKEAVVGRYFWETPWWHHDPELQARIKVAVTQAAAGESVHLEVTHQDITGSLHVIEFSLKPALNAEGAIVYLIPEGHDITDRRLLEQQVMQQQKLEGVGLLAGGIAHDFNNLLTPIFGYAEMIRKKFNPGEPIYVRASAIIEAATRAKDLVKQLLSFSRKQILSTQLYDLNEIIESFITIMLRTIRENIEINLSLCAESCPVHVDRTQIEQILLNLAVNAQDAIVANGRIVIETGHLVLDDEYCYRHPGARPGRYILLAFTDTGSGMDDTTLAHIFVPFFTTKPVGHGTGLGLSTVYGIVKQHEGYIDAQSKPGGGTTFRIYLPESAGSEQVERVVEMVVTQGTETAGTILLVEDNSMVMEMVRDLLEMQGHQVLCAGEPQAAIELARANATRINLLISDVIMPQMNGPELYGRLSEIIPGLHVLFMSGYANNLSVHDGLLEEGVNFIAKPFTSETLIEQVSRMLAPEQKP